MSSDPFEPKPNECDPDAVDQPSADMLHAGLQAAYQKSPQPQFHRDESDGLDNYASTRAEAIGDYRNLVINDRYRLIEKIGEGGMGTVWLAEQFAPMKRQVAIKLIKPGMDSRTVIARFEAERQALALMDHPNIAKVLDGGVTATGQPYFVLELVRGIPITRYCDELKLTPRDRLQLFIPVCNAIQHAHQKGLIHRDIKPSNILIALFDGVPVPKVIDFGVAKAVGTALIDSTPQTGFDSVVGTLEYMSPEQASFNNRDIDTRSDIYSLGVVLYELLAGNPPFDRGDLQQYAIDEVLRVIREVDPPRPSHKLSTARTRASIAAVRSLEPERLSRFLRNDLDWIVMKALEKDRSRRYATPAGLGEEIQRFLQGDAVQAAPPSLFYRARKWYWRNRRATIAATLLLVSLIAGTIGTGWGYFNAQHERKKADLKATEATAASQQSARDAESARIAVADMKTFADHLVNDFLAVARPAGWNGGLGIDVSVREALMKAEDRIAESFQGRPTAEVTARRAHAITWQELGDYRRAETHWRRIAELYQTEPDLKLKATDSLWLEARTRLAANLLRQSRLTEAKELFTQALNEYGDQGMENSSLTWPAVAGLAEIDLNDLRPQHALDQLLPILGEAEGALPEHVESFMQISTLVSAAYEALGKMDEAVKLDDRLLNLSREKFGSDHLLTLFFSNNVAQNHWKLKQYDKAIPQFRTLLDSAQRLLGPDHPETLQIQCNLAANVSDGGEPDKAEPLFKELIPLLEKQLGPHHEKTLEARKLAGIAVLKQKRFAEAEQLLKEVWADSNTWLGQEQAETIRALSHYCEAVQQSGQLEAAIPLREKLLSLRRKHSDRIDSDVLPTMNNLASLYWRTGKLDKSIPLFRETVELCEKTYGPTDRRTLQSMANLAVNLRDNQQLESAIPVMEKVHSLAAQHPGLEWTEQELASMYLTAGRFDAAKPILEKDESRLRTKLGQAESATEKNPLQVADRLSALAKNLVRQNRHVEARALLEKAITVYESLKPNGWWLAYAKSMLAETLIRAAEIANKRETETETDVAKTTESKDPESSKPEPPTENAEELLKRAESLLIPAYHDLTRLVGKDQTHKANQEDTRKRLRELYETWNKPDEAAKWK